MFLDIETLEDHSQLPKQANKYSIWAVANFSYVSRQGHVHARTPSLHRESTDSLITLLLYVCIVIYKQSDGMPDRSLNIPSREAEH